MSRRESSVPRMSLGAMSRAVTCIPPELERAVPLTIALCDQGAMLLRGRQAQAAKTGTYIARCVNAIEQAASGEQSLRERLDAKQSKFEARLAVLIEGRNEERQYEADERNKKAIEVRRRKTDGSGLHAFRRAAATKKEHTESRVSPHTTTAAFEEHQASRRAISAVSAKDWHEHLVRSCISRNERAPCEPYLRSERERTSQPPNCGKLTDISVELRLAEERHLRETPKLDDSKNHLRMSTEASSLGPPASFDERWSSLQAKSKKVEAKLASSKAEDEAYRQEIAAIRQKKFDSVLQRRIEKRSADQRRVERKVCGKSSPSPHLDQDQVQALTFNGSQVWGRVNAHIQRARHIEEKRTDELEKRAVSAGMKYVEHRLLAAVM